MSAISPSMWLFAVLFLVWCWWVLRSAARSGDLGVPLFHREKRARR